MTDFLTALVAHLPAILSALAALVAAVTAMIAAWKNGKQIEENTTITRKGVENAALAADHAQAAVKVVQATADETSRKLNGGLDVMLAEVKSAAYIQGAADAQKKAQAAQTKIVGPGDSYREATQSGHS